MAVAACGGAVDLATTSQGLGPRPRPPPPAQPPPMYGVIITFSTQCTAYNIPRDRRARDMASGDHYIHLIQLEFSNTSPTVLCSRHMEWIIDIQGAL